MRAWKPNRLQLAGLAVVILAVAVAFSPAGRWVRSKPNQRQPSTSPSGKYVLTVPIEAGRKSGSDGVWTVTICDSHGKQLYQDDDSNFIEALNVYWIWDDDDRVWLYNSDTSDVFVWELEAGKWTKARWGYGKNRQSRREIYPPPGLYPDYAK
jgi:hypothetical protein